MSIDFLVTFSMIFEDTYQHSINRQEYDNKQRKNHKEEKTNRTKIVVEAMPINLACIIILLLFILPTSHILTLKIPCQRKESNLLISDKSQMRGTTTLSLANTNCISCSRMRESELSSFDFACFSKTPLNSFGKVLELESS